MKEKKQIQEYLKSLEAGERVLETGVSGLRGRAGTVYKNDKGDACVMWDKTHNETGHMGTSATGGTRRIRDVEFSLKSF